MPGQSVKVVVFGGSGFIGSRLVSRLLSKEHRVVVADIVPAKEFPEHFRYCDVRDAGAVNRVCDGTDAIYNLAAVHRDDVYPRSLYSDVNVGGATNICAAAAASGVNRVIFTSSCAVYGACDDELSEDARPAPFNDYGVSKLEAEEVHKRWAVEHGERALTIVRPTVVFGEGNRGNVFTLIDQIARGRFAVVGDGKNMKSLAYVENVASFLEHILHDNYGTNVYNYVDKPDYTTGDLVRTIRQQLGRLGDGPHIPYTVAMALGACCDAFAALSGRRLPFSRIRVRKFCAPSRFSSARAMASGFAPAYALADGLQQTIKYEVGGHVSPSPLPRRW